MRSLGAVAVLVPAAQALGAEPETGFPRDSPVNQWRRCPLQTEGPYVYAQLVYVPDRGQVLRWDWPRGRAHSEMLALDVAQVVWLVVLVGMKKAVGMAVRRQDTSRRYTALRQRLREV
jgi:hypothetical protein